MSSAKEKLRAKSGICRQRLNIISFSPVVLKLIKITISKKNKINMQFFLKHIKFLVCTIIWVWNWKTKKFNFLFNTKLRSVEIWYQINQNKNNYRQKRIHRRGECIRKSCILFENEIKKNYNLMVTCCVWKLNSSIHMRWH